MAGQRQAMFVDIITKSGASLLAIINDILDFSKIDAGHLDLDQAPFHLVEAIEDVATLVSAKTTEKDLELLVRIDPLLPIKLIGDVGRFRQIATNLVGNAAKFTEKGYVLIDVTGNRNGDKVELTVSVEDSGIGIPAEKISTIFDKFAQVDASSTRKHEGTGLGLAIASRLVDLMQGKIGVNSVVANGSKFWFTVSLPIDKSNDLTRPSVPRELEGARVLVVDDNDTSRSILIEQIRSWGFDCAAVDSGPVALTFLKHAHHMGIQVDCVILDYQMPEMKGDEVAKEIHDSPEIPPVPMILLTSLDPAEVVHFLPAFGIETHLHRPARSLALLDALASVITKARTSKPSVDEREQRRLRRN